MATLRAKRKRAHDGQSGICYYCEAILWELGQSAYARCFGIAMEQAERFKATAEHINPQKDGGTHAQWNIASSCETCNKARGATTVTLTPLQFKHLVRGEVQQGGWHPAWAFDSGIVSKTEFWQQPRTAAIKRVTKALDEGLWRKDGLTAAEKLQLLQRGLRSARSLTDRLPSMGLRR
jgi:hypothetical protein